MEKQQTSIILESINSINENSRVEILVLDSETNKRANQIFTFVGTRTRGGQVTIGANTDTTLANLVSAVNLDLPVLFSAELQQASKVKIDVLNPSIIISDVISFNPILGLPIFNPIIGVVPWNPFRITSVNISQSIDKCSFVRVKVETNLTMTSFCRNYKCSNVNSSFVEFEVARGGHLNIKATRNEFSDNRTLLIPSLLSAPIITVFNSPFGATATAENQNLIGLDLLFSIDNINWQSQNVFSGLDVGDYTLYVKDQFGCIKSKSFSVLENSFGVEPNVFISKENSFRFKEPNGNYLDDENQFFNQSYNEINYCFEQEFLNTDLITTQFKSNYQLVEVYVKDLNTDLTTQLFVQKKTNNIGLTQKFSNVKKYTINNSQFGIYFESGNILNYDTNIPEQSYDLNGSLPIWAKIGNYLNIDGAFYQINAIGFDDSVNAEVLIFDGVASQQLEEVDVSCIFNLQNYEIYEFELDFSNYQQTKIQIQIKNLDPNFGEYNWISERLISNESLNHHLEIRYYNSTNTNVVYSTGIKHLLRIPFNKIKAVDSDSSENYNADTNTYLLDSKIHEITEFDFMPFPLELWRKVKIALSVDTIFIDGVGYSKNAEFTKEALGNTNLYKVTAQMIKNGFVFNSSMNSNEILIDNPTVNIPGLLQNDSDSFIQY